MSGITCDLDQRDNSDVQQKMSTSRATLRAQLAALREQNDRLTQELEQALREGLPTTGGSTAAGVSGDSTLLSHEESVMILEAQRARS